MTAAAFGMVYEVVTAHRRAGEKAPYAIYEAADVLGVSPRWVTSVLRNEPHAVKPGRLAKLSTRFIAWMEADIARSEQKLAERKAALDAFHDDARGQGTLLGVLGEVA